MKKAILAVSYGTSYADALTNSIEAVENTFRETFPDYTICRAFTGRRIVEMLAKKQIYVDSVETALEKLIQNGYKEVILQPTHILNGNEYEKICKAADTFRERFSVLQTGVPLLHEQGDTETLCRFFAQKYCHTTDALVLMGHGSDHYANKLYADFGDTCRSLGYKNLFIAALEAPPTIDDILPKLKEAGYRKITVTPLLFVAGSHACKDMAGSEPDSWKSRLEAEGFSVTVIVKGLGEYAEIRDLYAKHLLNTIKCRQIHE